MLDRLAHRAQLLAQLLIGRRQRSSDLTSEPFQLALQMGDSLLDLVHPSRRGSSTVGKGAFDALPRRAANVLAVLEPTNELARQAGEAGELRLVPPPFLASLQARHGSARGYATAAGVAADVLDRLATRLIEAA